MPARLAADTTYVIVPGKDERSLDLLRKHLPQGRVVDEGPLHYNEPYFVAYQIPAGAEARVKPAYPMVVNFGDRIQLLGYDLDKLTHQTGETVHLTLYYQCLRPMRRHYTVFTHLLGPYNPTTDGPLWAQDDSEPCRGFYPTTSWEVGEIVIDRFTLPVPADTPSGEYDLSMGFYNLWTMQRLAVLGGDGQAKDEVISLGPVQVIGAE